jgi:hypothetical protein
MIRKFLMSFTFLGMLCLLGLSGCERDATPSLFVPDKPSDRPDPVITSVDPVDVWLAGVGTITINGNNFSDKPEENLVFFGKIRAEVVSAASNRLVVKSPNTVSDSIDIRVSVVGAYLFSNTVKYALQTAIEEIGRYGNENEDLYGIAVDLNENLYLSVVKPGAGNQLHRITPDGSKDAPYATLPTFRGDNMRMGPNNEIFFVRKNRNIYTINIDTKTGGLYKNLLPDNEYDLDFDPDDNIYIAGDGNSLALVYAADKSVEVVANYPNTFIKTVRYFNGYIYTAGEDANGNHRVWRNKINSVNSLDSAEQVFDLTAVLGPDAIINNMEIAADGDIYLATNQADPVIIVHPGGDWEPLYPGLWLPNDGIAMVGIEDLVWGNDNYMYATRVHTIRDNDGNPKNIQNALKINMLKPGATYYGRQ